MCAAALLVLATVTSACGEPAAELADPPHFPGLPGQEAAGSPGPSPATATPASPAPTSATAVPGPPPPPPTAPAAPATPSVRTVTFSTFFDEPQYTVAAAMPVAEGIADRGAAAAINLRIETLYERLTGEYRSLALAAEPAEGNEGSLVDLSYRAGRVDREVVGLLIFDYRELAGAPTPAGAFTSLISDPVTGEAIVLEDVVGRAGMAGVMRLVEERLLEDLYDGDAVAFRPWRARVRKGGIAAWLPTDAGLDVAFGIGEAAPPAAGPVIVSLAYDEVAAVANRRAPEASLLVLPTP